MDNNNFDESVVNQNDDVEQQVPKELTKKEKAEKASKDIADITARGLGRYFGGNAGAAAVDTALKTKWGQGIQKGASKIVANIPGMKGNLARSYGFVNKYKDTAHQVLDKIGSTSYDSSDSDNVSNNDTNIKDKGVISGLWEKLPLKTKLIIIGIAASFIFVIIFLIILITPLMELGIIDIKGIGKFASYHSPNHTYTSISNNAKYWWPIGSAETTTENGVVFASGEPASTYITSDFNDRESFRNSNHGGIDIGNNGHGSGVINIIAVQDGTVIYPSDASQVAQEDSGYLEGGGYGNYVKIQHADGTITVYAHLYKDSVTVFAGDIVRQGQVIAKMGASGNVTGTHLHFEVISNGVKDYPLNYISAENPRLKSATIVGTSVKQTVCLTLKNMGIPDNGIAGIMTNMRHESNFNPEAQGDKENGVYTSYGLCQWHKGRKNQLIKSFPDTYNTVDSQLQYLLYELENKPSYKKTYNAIYDTDMSVSDITNVFCTNFEIPRDTVKTCNNRRKESATFAEYVKNGCQ